MFKVNRVSNALDIVNALNFKSSSATEAVTKIEKLYKIVVGEMSQLRIYSWLRSLRTTFQMALINTMAYLDREQEIHNKIY